MHFTHPAMTHLTHQRDRLQPAEAFLDPLSLSLAEGVTRVPRGAAINRAAAAPRMVLRHMRRHSQIPALFHEIPRVKSFVSAYASPVSCREVFSSITSAASRSAVPLAWNTSASTISPLRFSTNRFPV